MQFKKALIGKCKRNDNGLAKIIRETNTRIYKFIK